MALLISNAAVAEINPNAAEPAQIIMRKAVGVVKVTRPMAGRKMTRATVSASVGHGSENTSPLLAIVSQTRASAMLCTALRLAVFDRKSSITFTNCPDMIRSFPSPGFDERRCKDWTFGNSSMISKRSRI